METLKWLSIFLTVLCSIKEIDGNAAMAVDFGARFMKVAIVMPGRPMEVVLDSESLRKTPTAIGFRDGERLFGRAAISLFTRSPELVYQAIPTLLGKTLDHPVVQEFQRRYPYHNMTYDETIGQIVFEHPGGIMLTVEELAAMLLEYSRDTAESHAEKGTVLRSAVITVPPYYGQAERRSLVRAAELAGLEVIQLINTGSAVGLNFGVFRQRQFNETPQYFMFFDIGYSDTVATVVSYHVGKHHYDGVSGEDPIMTVLGVGYDSHLGTSTFIKLLRDHLANVFRQQKPHIKGDIFQNKRAMAKLTQEAERVFTTLSANTEVVSQIEALFSGEDFHAKVNRVDLETVGAAAFDRIRQPFTDALQAANLSVSAIQEIVLMGGGTRVPKVQSILMELGARSELGKGVNSDEAAVLGAVYQAAARTPGFKVVRLILRDYNPYSIAVDFERAPAAMSSKSDKTNANTDSSSNNSPHARMVLFSHGSPYPLKRAITFNRHLQDLTFFVNYAELGSRDSAHLRVTNLTQITTKGVAAAVDRFKNTEARGVKAHFVLDHSGLLVLTGVDCVFHPLPETSSSEAQSNEDQSTLQKIGNKISGFFGGGAGTDKPQGTENDSNSTAGTQSDNSTVLNATQPGENVTNGTDSNSTASEHASKPPVVAKKPSPFTERVHFEAVHVDASSPTDDHRAAFKQNLIAFREADQQKRELERAMNELESALFSTREKMESEAFQTYSSSDELTSLGELLTALTDWFEEQSITTPRELFEEKLGDIRKLLLPIELRIREAELRPKALQQLNETIVEATKFLQVMQDTMQRMKLQDEITPPVANDTTAEDETDSSSENKTKTPEPLPLPPLFTDTEQKTLEELLKNTQNWYEESTAKLASINPKERPPVLTSEFDDKQRHLKRELHYLNRKLLNWQHEMARLLKLYTEQKPPQKPETTDSAKKDTTPKPAPESEAPPKEAEKPKDKHQHVEL